VTIRRGLASAAAWIGPLLAPRVRSRGLVVGLLLVGSALALPPATLASTLPDNRVYEQVTPREKGSAIEPFGWGFAYPSTSGDAAIVPGGEASAAQPSDQSWIVRKRSAAGWITVGSELGPPIPPGFTQFQESTNGSEHLTVLAGVSPDLSRVLFSTGLPLDTRNELTSPDLYVHDSAGGPFTWVSGPPAPMTKHSGSGGISGTDSTYCEGQSFCFPGEAYAGGASTDLRTVVWSQVEKLVAPPNTLPPGDTLDTRTQGAEVYESVNGAPRLVGLLPDGSVPACGAALGDTPDVKGFAPVQGAVSPDGTQVVFTSPDPNWRLGCPPPEVYLRVRGESTVAISASQKNNGSGPAGRDPHGPQAKWFVGSVNDGSEITKIFFVSSEELTNNANTGSADGGADLYEYDVATHGLTDLTADANPADANGAGVIGFAGASADGSIVYFAANGALAPGATPGQPNLYAHNANTADTKFIASAAGMLKVGGNGEEEKHGVIFPGHQRSHLINGEFLPTNEPKQLSTRVTPDGRHMIFLDSESLSPLEQGGHAEVYLYDEGSNRLTCVSCDPAGAPPVAGSQMSGASGVLLGTEQNQALAPWTGMSDDGTRVFFASPDQLTPDAPEPMTAPGLIVGSVHLYSTYEWENGRIYLISAAEPGYGSSVPITTTPSGNDVFFATARPLVPSDTDGTVDIYDARVGGGFTRVTAPSCTGEGCQGVPGQGPVFATPASVTFNGVGNFAEPGAEPVTPNHKARKKAKKKRTRRRARKARKHRGRGSRTAMRHVSSSGRGGRP
jgi:hypothetical protein